LRNGKWYVGVVEIEDLLTTTQIADLIGVSRQRVEALRKEHDDFPAPVGRVGRQQVWHRDAIYEWWDSHPYGVHASHTSSEAVRWERETPPPDNPPAPYKGRIRPPSKD